MTVKLAAVTSLQARKLEKQGFENKGVTDMQADEVCFYGLLHDADCIYADDMRRVQQVMALPLWKWRKWFFTDPFGQPIVIFFERRQIG